MVFGPIHEMPIRIRLIGRDLHCDMSVTRVGASAIPPNFQLPGGEREDIVYPTPSVMAQQATRVYRALVREVNKSVCTNLIAIYLYIRH